MGEKKNYAVHVQSRENRNTNTAHRSAGHRNGWKKLLSVICLACARPAGQRHSCPASDTRRKNVRPHSFAFAFGGISAGRPAKNLCCAVTPNGHGIRTNLCEEGPQRRAKKLLCHWRRVKKTIAVLFDWHVPFGGMPDHPTGHS